jgi:diguanylate cyclase (GGDEF)-like protein
VQTLAEQIGQSVALQEDLGLVYIKILNLRRINNTLGYQCGDAVLREVHARLETLIRKKDLLARIGDSEFALILSSVMGEGHAVLAANKILLGAAGPMTIGAAEVTVQLVLGIALLSQDVADAETLIANAETAMLTAVARELDYSVYSTRIGMEQERDWALDEGINEAIEIGQLDLLYQPKVCLRSGRVMGAEILMQWNHPEYGVIPPSKLQAVAERTGNVTQLTWWALKTAMRSACGWSQPWDRLPLSINLSRGMLHDQELAPLILSTVSLCGVSPYCLVIEIAEELALSDPLVSSLGLQRLRDAGVGVCIDGFGIGCVSLASLKQFPLDELKVHGSFVAHLQDDRQDRLIVTSLIQLAHNFGLKIVAEGVGDQSTADTLSGLGCDYAQGTWFAPPLRDEDLLAWLAGRDPSQARS